MHRLTPSPWKVRSEPTMNSGDAGDSRWWYSFEATGDMRTIAEHRANAKAMALAGELLAALTELVDAHTPTKPRRIDHAVAFGDRRAKAFAAARAVIRKARAR